MPSLPRVLPKTLQLITTLSNLGREEIQARDLLVLFLALVEEIKFWTVLEDKLDILISFCSELVTFHQILCGLLRWPCSGRCWRRRGLGRWCDQVAAAWVNP